MLKQKNFLLAILGAFLLVFILQFPRLIDPYTVEEDFRTYHWMHRFQNPDLFQDDLTVPDRNIDIHLGDKVIIVDTASPIYSGIFQIASPLISPVLFSKLLAFPLLLTAVYFMYGIGLMIHDDKLALQLSLVFIIVNLASHSSTSTIGGLQRSFIIPLLLGVIYFMMRQRAWATAVILIISGLIYPPAFLLGAIAFGLSTIQYQPQKKLPLRLDWKRVSIFLFAGTFVLIMLLPFFLRPDSNASARTGFILNNPTFQPGGRSPIFDLFPLVGRGGLLLNIRDIYFVLFFFIASLVTWKLQPSTLENVPTPVKQLFFAGVITYGLSWGVILATSSFLLYMPSRYLMPGFVIFGVIYVTTNFSETVHLLAKSVIKQKKAVAIFSFFIIALTLLLIWNVEFPPRLQTPFWLSLRWVGTGLSGLLTLLIILILRQDDTLITESTTKIPSLIKWIGQGLLLFGSLLLVFTWTPPFLTIPENHRPLLSYIETLPDDSILFGSPCLLSDIPTFSKRQVLFSCEQPHPNNDVTQQALAAYYAPSFDKILNFCQLHQVNYFVVNEADFTPRAIQSGLYYYEPFNSMLAPTIQPQENFALMQIPKEDKLFQIDDIFIVSCEE